MSLKKPYLVIAVLGVCVASGAAWWWQNKPAVTSSNPTPMATGPGATGASGAQKAAVVEVAKVDRMRLVDETQSVGSLRSNQGVILRPEVGGRVSQLPMAQVMQSKAELSIAQANHKRNQELVAQNFISKRSLDESDAALQVALAKLALSQATAERFKVLAPFDGVAGLRQINVGDYLKDGADMVNIEDIDAVLLDFRLPERFQAKIKPGQKAQVAFDALPGRNFTAMVQAIDPLIDANGRSVGVRACIDNRQMQLRPGMFARVNAIFGERTDALVLPEEAIVPQGGRSFVVKLVPGAGKGELISQRVQVKIGLRQPGKVEILEGLEFGETVVTAGHQRLQKDGTAVQVVDMTKPESAAGPAGTPAAAPGGPSGGMTAGAGPAAAGQGGPGAGKGQSKAPPAVSGENPCLRGLNAAR